jgi:Rieske Fe-S protein
MAVQSEVQPAPTRRNFIVWTMTGLLGAFGAMIVAPIIPYVWPAPRKGQKNGDIQVTLQSDLDSLKDGDAEQFQAPNGQAFILQTGGGNNQVGDPTFGAYAVNTGHGITVLSVTCTHLGCSVSLDKQAKLFKCPCHGSQFNLDGNVVHGPATAPLSKLAWKKGDKPNQIKVYGINFGQGG